LMLPWVVLPAQISLCLTLGNLSLTQFPKCSTSSTRSSERATEKNEVFKLHYFIIQSSISNIHHLLIRFLQSIKHFQNLKAIEATSWYSCLPNLYFRVVKNLGLTSITNPFRSSTTVAKSESSIPVLFSISLFHVLVAFFNPRAERIKLAAAISDGLYFRRLASSKEISWMYWAKKYT